MAFSPSTGAVGVMGFAYQSAFAHASCLSKALNQTLGSVNLKQAERFVNRHHKKIAILKGKLPNGNYQLFMATRPSNRYGFSQEQTEYQSLLRQCQAATTGCEIVGQFGQTTELY